MFWPCAKTCLGTTHLGQLQVIDLKMTLGNSPCKSRPVQWTVDHRWWWWHETREPVGRLEGQMIFVLRFLFNKRAFTAEYAFKNSPLTSVSRFRQSEVDTLISTVSENSIRLGRKKHQIASNCVVLHLGTEIEIGSQWFIATGDHKNAGTRNGGLADVALYYIGKGWSKHILISYLNHFFLIWVPPGLTSSCIYIYVHIYIPLYQKDIFSI